MSIPSELDSIFLYSNGFAKKFDVEGGSCWNPFLSKQQIQYSPTYGVQHAPTSNLVDSCNLGNAGYHHGLLAHPSLMPPMICNYNLPTYGLSRNRLTRTDPTQKSWNHKLVEKQRRKDMTTLFSTLRSLLPEENIRGKRRTSDLVLEAVNYVRQMEQKIEDLSTERDKMKAEFDEKEKVSFESVLSSSNEKFYCNGQPAPGSDGKLPAVKIKSVGSSVNVSIDAFKEQIVYSNLLLVLEECGLEFVSAASSAVNKRVFYTIYTKVSDINKFDLDALCDKFWESLRSNHIQADLRTVADKSSCREK